MVPWNREEPSHPNLVCLSLLVSVFFVSRIDGSAVFLSGTEIVGQLALGELITTVPNSFEGAKAVRYAQGDGKRSKNDRGKMANIA